MAQHVYNVCHHKHVSELALKGPNRSTIRTPLCGASPGKGCSGRPRRAPQMHTYFRAHIEPGGNIRSGEQTSRRQALCLSGAVLVGSSQFGAPSHATPLAPLGPVGAATGGEKLRLSIEDVKVRPFNERLRKSWPVCIPDTNKIRPDVYSG